MKWDADADLRVAKYLLSSPSRLSTTSRCGRDFHLFKSSTSSRSSCSSRLASRVIWKYASAVANVDLLTVFFSTTSPTTQERVENRTGLAC